MNVYMNYEVNDGEYRDLELEVVYTAGIQAADVSDPDAPGFADPGGGEDLDFIKIKATDGNPVPNDLVYDEHFIEAVLVECRLNNERG